MSTFGQVRAERIRPGEWLRIPYSGALSAFAVEVGLTAGSRDTPEAPHPAFWDAGDAMIRLPADAAGILFVSARAGGGAWQPCGVIRA